MVVNVYVHKHTYVHIPIRTYVHIPIHTYMKMSERAGDKGREGNPVVLQYVCTYILNPKPVSAATQDAQLKKNLLAVFWSLLPLNLELTIAYNEQRPQQFGKRTGVMNGGKPGEVVLNPLATPLWESLQALKACTSKPTCMCLREIHVPLKTSHTPADLHRRDHCPHASLVSADGGQHYTT